MGLKNKSTRLEGRVHSNTDPPDLIQQVPMGNCRPLGLVPPMRKLVGKFLSPGWWLCQPSPATLG